MEEGLGSRRGRLSLAFLRALALLSDCQKLPDLVILTSVMLSTTNEKTASLLPARHTHKDICGRQDPLVRLNERA